MKVSALALMTTLFHHGTRGAEVPGTVQAGTDAVMVGWCDLIAARGNCDTMGDLCPTECGQGNSSAAANRGGPAPAPDQICSAVAASGACNPTVSNLCPAVCDAASTPPPAPPAGQPIATTCAVLIGLGGCSHDLSLQDPSAAPGTRVSDVCPDECSGLGGCAATVADVGFLGVARDSSGHEARVELGGDACVDGGGVALSGRGWVDVAVGSEYISGGACTVSLWLLKGAAKAWDRDGAVPARREVLFSHPAAEHGDFLTISLARTAWHDHFTLEVTLGTVAVWSFALSAHRDAVPMWTHLSVVVDGNSAWLYRDGIDVEGERGQVVHGGAYIGCYTTGATGSEMHGHIDQGSLTSAAVGCDGNSNFCHSEGGALVYGTSRPGGWQVPVENVDPTETQSLCSAMCSRNGYRYMGLQWSDRCYCDNSYYGSRGVANGCGDMGRNCGDGLLTCIASNAVFDVQTTFLPDTEFSAERATFRGAGLAGTAIIGASEFHHSGLRGSVAMFQIYPNALPPGRATCVYMGGQRLVESGRLALLADTTCREAVTNGCTSHGATNGPGLGPHDTAAAVDDGSCTFEQPAGAASDSGVVHVTDEWQIVALHGSYVKPLVFCNLLSRSSTAQVRGNHSMAHRCIPASCPRPLCAQAFIRIDNLQADQSGAWSFGASSLPPHCHRQCNGRF